MYKAILLPIDMELTELSARAIVAAEDLAERYGASLTALTAIPDLSSYPMVANYFPDDAGQQAHDEAYAELKKFVGARFKAPDRVTCEVQEGSPRKVIVRFVEEHGIDLVIMPARKTDLGKILLGSNSSHVADHASCSVLVVRS